MRTYLVVVGSVLGLVLATGSAAAAGPHDELLDPMRSLLQRLGVLPPTKSSGEPTPASPVEMDPAREGARSLIDGVFDLVGESVDLASQSLLALGLGLVWSLFGGIGEGGETIAAAVTSVVAHPIESGLIAGLTLAFAGAAALVYQLLQRYGSLGAIPLYSRIAKSALLENRVRQEIFQLIQQDPGINVSEISRRLDIAWGTATHHLHKLRQERLVSIRIASNQKCYFQNGGSYTPQEMNVLSATKNPTAKRIAEFLVRYGPRSHGDLAGALGLSPALVSFHASKLVEQGVMARHREGRRTIFTALEASLEPQPRPTAPH